MKISDQILSGFVSPDEMVEILYAMHLSLKKSSPDIYKYAVDLEGVCNNLAGSIRIVNFDKQNPIHSEPIRSESD